MTTSLNMAHNSNKLTKLDGQQNEIVSGPLIHRVGEPTIHTMFMNTPESTQRPVKKCSI